MKIKLRNGSTIETIDIEVENIKRSKHHGLKYYNKQLDDVLKPFCLKWYQKLYLKFISLIKNKIYRNSRFYISSKYYRK